MIHATCYFNRYYIFPGDKTSILNITFAAPWLKQFPSPIGNRQDRRKPHRPAITGPGTHCCVLLVFCDFLNLGARITVRPCSAPTAIAPRRAAFSRQPMQRSSRQGKCGRRARRDSVKDVAGLGRLTPQDRGVRHLPGDLHKIVGTLPLWIKGRIMPAG